MSTASSRRFVLLVALTVGAFAGLIPLMLALDFPPSTILPMLGGVLASFVAAALGSLLAALVRKVPIKGQQQMNQEAYAEFDAAEKRLRELLENIRSRDLSSKEREALELSQSAWEKYRDAHAKFVAAECEGGTMWPLLYATEKAELTAHRAKQIEQTLRQFTDLRGPE